MQIRVDAEEYYELKSRLSQLEKENHELKVELARNLPTEERMKITLDEGAKLPTRAHEADAGLDLYSREEVIVYAGESEIFDTGVHIELPKNTVGFLKSKSGLYMRHGITGEGVIDEGYTGSIRVMLRNHSDTHYVVHEGDKISQLVILPILKPELELVDSLEDTERGENGFGSSGR